MIGFARNPQSIMSQAHCLADKCLAAFGNYTREAEKTCGLLGELGGPASLDRLLVILEQSQIEAQAQETYLLLRQQLFELLENTDAVRDC
jgi:hypothetical protein